VLREAAVIAPLPGELVRAARVQHGPARRRRRDLVRRHHVHAVAPGTHPLRRLLGWDLRDLLQRRHLAVAGIEQKQAVGAAAFRERCADLRERKHGGAVFLPGTGCVLWQQIGLSRVQFTVAGEVDQNRVVGARRPSNVRQRVEDVRLGRTRPARLACRAGQDSHLAQLFGVDGAYGEVDAAHVVDGVPEAAPLVQVVVVIDADEHGKEPAHRRIIGHIRWHRCPPLAAPAHPARAPAA